MIADIRSIKASVWIVAIVIASLSAGASAANVVIVNVNGAGVGFNDTSTPNPAAGCNVGETLGQCRLRVFNQAAAQWGTLLQSNVTISVNGQMTSLTCSGTSAVLGSAGPASAHANFANAPRPNVAYVQALANSWAEADLSGSNDLNANFNQDIDNGTCLNGTAGWWYGTDPSIPAPADRTPLLPVVFHEIGHGIGFTSLYSSTNGAPSTGVGTPIWGFYLFDTETNLLWKDMSNAQRQASAINDPDLVWTGPLTNAWSPVYLGPPAKAIINSPPGIAGTYDAQTAEFGASVTTPTTGNVVLVNDGVGTTRDGCETPFANAGAVAGNIALIERGTCTFAAKVKNAQLNGAIGALLFNNTTGLPPMGGSDSTITISSLGISQALGNSIIANLPAPGVNATLGVQTGGALAGTQEGCVRMFAPNPVQSGSSVSHFHSDAFPNLLMEPSLNSSIFNKVDLTLALFRDIGWRMNAEDVVFLDPFDFNPCAEVQP
jgi:hypothetical protein